MLSIIHAAEMQFRHESAERAREQMLIAAIREREAALSDRRDAPAARIHVWPVPVVAKREALECPAPA